jgi:mannose-6-phosphate isomerase-like protein (cupin superfamily)
MKILDRIVTFARVSPVDTGCGKIYYLASTDLIHYSLPMTASFELADQTGPGELHQHHTSHETYICIGGEGIFYWGIENKYPIKEGDIFNIAPNTLHALNALPGKSVRVLVVSYPQFTQSDLYPITDTTKKRKDEKPPFFAPNAPKYGVLVTHSHLTISRIIIKQPYIAAAVQLLFVLQGAGTFKTAGQEIGIFKYDSMAMERGDSIIPQSAESIYAITVQIK